MRRVTHIIICSWIKCWKWALPLFFSLSKIFFPHSLGCQWNYSLPLLNAVHKTQEPNNPRKSVSKNVWMLFFVFVETPNFSIIGIIMRTGYSNGSSFHTRYYNDMKGVLNLFNNENVCDVCENNFHWNAINYVSNYYIFFVFCFLFSAKSKSSYFLNDLCLDWKLSQTKTAPNKSIF